MTTRIRHDAMLGLGALTALALLLCTLAADALALSPLPRADYTVRAACPKPSPGHASCLSLQLVPHTAEARARNHPIGVASALAHPSSAATGTYGLRPSDLHSAYQLPVDASSEQTIAIVDAYNDPTAEADLKAYDEELGLPACTTGGVKCFKKVNQSGSAEAGNLPFPKSTTELNEARASSSKATREEAAEAEGWGVEISLDIETAHAICQNCKILLVEANTPEFSDLESAEKAAETLGAGEISNSWGGPEEGETSTLESKSPFNHRGTVITIAAGDNGYLDWASKEPSRQADFPASSPHVVAVGGTRLTVNAGTFTWHSETVWNDGAENEGFVEGNGAGGGGCSKIFAAQPWQSSVSDWSEVGCSSKRAVADVAADGDPYSGVAVYYAKCEHGPWCTYGGTSLASPIIAATYALAGGAHGVEYPAQTLYKNLTAHPASLHDVFSGSNGECLKPFEEATGISCTSTEEATSCSLKAICLAHSGYDGPSGVGSPHGIDAFEPSPAAETSEEKAAHKAEVEQQEAAEQAEAAERKEAIEHQEEIERKEQKKRQEEAKRREEAERREAEELEQILRYYERKGTGAGGGLPVAPAPVGPAPAAAAAGPQLSAFALTLKALFALNAAKPKLTQVAFAFTLNVSMQVKITFAKHVRVHKHTRWQTTGSPLTIAAKAGRTSAHLGGHMVLKPGIYRLTATPAHAAARSILFQIG